MHRKLVDVAGKPSSIPRLLRYGNSMANAWSDLRVHLPATGFLASPPARWLSQIREGRDYVVTRLWLRNIGRRRRFAASVQMCTGTDRSRTVWGGKDLATFVGGAISLIPFIFWFVVTKKRISWNGKYEGVPVLMFATISAAVAADAVHPVLLK